MTSPRVLLLIAASAVPTLAGLAAALWFGLDSGAMQRVIDTPGIGLSVASSFWTGAVATVLALFLAHLAVALAYGRRSRNGLAALTLPLLAMPHLAVGIGLALLLAPSGLLMRLVSPWATGLALPPDWLTVQDPFGLSLIAGLVIKETCFLIMALVAALSQVPAARLQQQARLLGYGSLKAWLTSVAPLLQKQIYLPLAAVLVFGMTNVELAIPLGPDLPPTFSVMLWRWFIDPDPAIHAQAYAGTLLLLAMTLVSVLVALALGRLLRNVRAAITQSGRRRRAERATRRAARGLLSVLWAVGLLTIAAIALRAAAGSWRFPALLPQGNVVPGWSEVLSVAGATGRITLGLAVATAIAGIALVLPAAEHCRENAATRRVVGIWLFLPLVVPQMTFLFGVQVLLARWRLDGSFIAVLWSHLLFALPYLWGLLAPARAAIDPGYRRVASTLGASPARIWLTVTAPLLTRALLLAFALAFSVSIALYLPTLFAGAGRVATAATEAAAAAASGSLRLAAMHSLLLTVAPLLAFAVAYTMRSWLFRHRQGVPR